ncbi:uncharacterized protein LOC107421360 isoform X2 [Ziziphus jujuba]|uniref:Uncharacterized protein LOC107421360 isoform X2 n=1 Tax=Ziziphus jujuba TaxID=326968 RepID=A0ABM4AA55_ZIZJJ|nr:uncharacterized protein LOC107421360 isoform X2 [Ziziphus jujuba]
MVKAVVGEETRLKLTEDRLANSSIPAQVGLVIGKLSSTLDRGFVFDLIPTPPNDAGDPACSLVESNKDDKKKGTKSKAQSSDSSSLVIDKDWVAEHARQTIKGVAEAAPFLETDWDERLIIHICYSPRRWTCRNCSLSSNVTSSSLRLCDFKMGRVLNSLQTFSCLYDFDLRLPIHHKRGTNVQTLTNVLRHGISVLAKELRGAKAIVDGNLVVNDEPCTSDGLHEIELLLPFKKDAVTEAYSLRDVIGLLAFSGSVCSYAYLNSKEPLSQAVADIKEDIIKSLQSRLDIICDEVDGDTGPADAGGEEVSDGISTETPISQLSLQLLRKTCSLSLPRRVFVPWLAETFVCDYLQQSETLQVLKDHLVELLSMEAMFDVSTVLEPEVEAPPVITKSFWDVAVPFCSASCSSSEKTVPELSMEKSSGKVIKSTNVNIILAAFFLVLSILVGFFLIAVRGS